ncbi:hypothetical protein [Spirosoma pulveris]
MVRQTGSAHPARLPDHREYCFMTMIYPPGGRTQTSNVANTELTHGAVKKVWYG